MAFKVNGKYLAYVTIRPSDVDYSGRIDKVIEECQRLSELHGVPLSEFDLSSTDDGYGSSNWEIVFTRKATEKEIAEVDAEEERRKNWRKNEYERLKKEFGKNV